MPGVLEIVFSDELPQPVAQETEGEGRSAQTQTQEAGRRLAELENRLNELRGERAMIGAQIEAAPITATSQKIGSMIVREQGCERLISRVEAEIERAREAAGRATPGEIARREWEFFGGLAPVLEIAPARVEGKPLDKRLAMAFPQGIPSDVARFFAWESDRAFSGEEAERLTDRHFSLRNPGQDIDAYMNLLVIRQLADVIRGQAEPDDSLARDLALESAWDVYPEWKREAIASGRRKEAEREKARAAEFEKEWAEREAQIAEALAAEAAAIAEVNALDLTGRDARQGI